MAIQIIEENRKPSFAKQVLSGAEAALPGLQQYAQKQEGMRNRQSENEWAKRQGVDLAGANDPELRKQIFASQLQGNRAKQEAERDFNYKNQLQEQKFNHENQLENTKSLAKKEVEDVKKDEERLEKLAPYETGLKSIQEMRKIIKKGNLGPISRVVGIFHANTRTDRAKYTQLGKSLISLSSNIPIRNKSEFETLAHDLYDPSNTDATNEAILEAMENIINSNIQQHKKPGSNQETNKETKAEKPSASSFARYK